MPIESPDRGKKTYFSSRRLSEILNQTFGALGGRLPRKGSRPKGEAEADAGRSHGRVLLGYYSVGKNHGVSDLTSRYLHLTDYLNRYLKHHCPDGTWTTIEVSLTDPDVIVSNYSVKCNTMCCLTSAGDFSDGGGEIWVESDNEDSDLIMKEEDDGTVVPGRLVSSSTVVVKLDQNSRYGLQPWTRGQR